MCQSNEETISYQKKLIRKYEVNIDYLQSKIPVGATNEEETKNSFSYITLKAKRFVKLNI